MKLKNILVLTGIMLSVSSVFAQYAEDALRFSQTENGVTARFRALGSAQTALGGDISSIASNPAGLGLFTKSELSFTPSHRSSQVDAGFNGSNSTNEKAIAGVNQLGLAIHRPSRRKKGRDVTTGFLSLNFGISFNKTNDFNTTTDYIGDNKTSSFADYLSDLSNVYLPNGNPATKGLALPSGSLEKMAYSNYLIEYNSMGYFPTTAVNPATGITNNQQNLLYNSGSQSEVNFALAGNYNNELYVGASLGLASLSYESDREFYERGRTRSYSGQPADFVNATYRIAYLSNQKTTGSGINAKIGFIYRPSSVFRVGMNLVTPTWYKMDDHFSEHLDTYYTRANGSAITPAYTNSPQEYYSSYTLKTPYRVNLGAALTFTKFGLITGDVEFVDYASARFGTDLVATENQTNKDIRNMYKSAVNYKVGIEAKVHPLVQLRAGYNITGNPYIKSELVSNTFSSGIGYRVKTLSFDLTFTNQSTTYSTSPYYISEAYPDINATGNGPVADVKNNINTIFATIGLRF